MFNEYNDIQSFHLNEETTPRVNCKYVFICAFIFIISMAYFAFATKIFDINSIFLK